MNIEDINLSFFESHKGVCKGQMTVKDYCNAIKIGRFKEKVEHAREVKKQSIVEYRKLKVEGPAIAGSAIITDGKTHHRTHVTGLNGLMVIDVDVDINDELLDNLKNDQYTMIMHKSLGGEGVCIFVKINPKAFRICFDELAEYYKSKYNVIIDAACKNENRMRAFSYDPDIYVNFNSKKFQNVKRKEKIIPVVEDFVFLESDFSDIVKQITSRHLDICNSYQEYLHVGFGIANQFGISGLSYFQAIAMCSDGYNERHCVQQYKNCCKADQHNPYKAITIATVYYYAKERGCTLYSDRTKQIVRTTSISKQNKKNGNTISGVSDVLATKGIETTDNEKKLIKQIWNSEKNYIKGVTSGDSDIDKVIDYIRESGDYYYDEIKNRIFVKKGQILQDYDINNLYLGARSFFYEDFKVQKTDIMSILNSSVIRRYNPLRDIFNVEVEAIQEGFIDNFAALLPFSSPEQLRYNQWVFKKWIVGMIHNWLCDSYDMKVSPLVLVLSGPQGNGKSTFVRHILPKELRDEYFLEERINAENKDSKLKLGQYLLLSDEEFGGLANKDQKAFKALSDLREVNERQAYKATADSFRRRAALCGTTNEMSILKDPTGNRRILPISTWNGKIDYARVKAFDTNKMLLEAYKLWCNGFEWELYTTEDMERLKQVNKDFEEADPYGDIFWKFFNVEQDDEYNVVSHKNTGEIIQWFKTHQNIVINHYQVADMFRRVGINSTSVCKINGKSKRGYYKLYSKVAMIDDDNVKTPF